MDENALSRDRERQRLIQLCDCTSPFPVLGTPVSGTGHACFPCFIPVSTLEGQVEELAFPVH